MKDILQKLSSYNIFNYLLPGIVFVGLLRLFTSYNLIVNEVIVGAFLYYFIGLIISRIGSLVIEPILKKTSLIKFSDYGKFISASKKDEKIELFSEVNNMYRTFISMLLILLLIVIYEKFSSFINLSHFVKAIIGLISLIIIFILAYKKQTGYINKRIDSQEDGN
jgi:uncharacterized membrane protein